MQHDIMFLDIQCSFSDYGVTRKCERDGSDAHFESSYHSIYPYIFDVEASDTELKCIFLDIYEYMELLGIELVLDELVSYGINIMIFI